MNEVGGPQDVGSGFASVSFWNSGLGTPLMDMLMADAIQPGHPPSYQLCKNIFTYHPLGAKIAELPLKKAMSRKRIISVPNGPEERCVKAFDDEWKALSADTNIMNTMRTSRIYGVAALGLMAKDIDAKTPIDPERLADLAISFNVWDPLNTAGSLVLNQDPNATDFQKQRGIAVSGMQYDRSRTVVMMNEEPIYIDYTNSAFGYVGRSVYQRALYPLKSFVQSMLTDDMVTTKAGLLIAKMETGGSIISNLMVRAGMLKRTMLRGGRTGNVLEIGLKDDITTLNMQNTKEAMGQARTNILNNIAAAVPMPAKLLNEETYAEGFGEGTEDAEDVREFVRNVREDMDPLYTFMDNICMRRAWNKKFYESIQSEYPEYKSKSYHEAFYEWKESFTATWPPLNEEPESEQVKTDDVKAKTIIATVETLASMLDPDNKATLIQWAAENLNENKIMFTTPLQLDYKALAAYVPPAEQMMLEGDDEDAAKPPAPFSSRA